MSERMVTVPPIQCGGQGGPNEPPLGPGSREDPHDPWTYGCPMSSRPAESPTAVAACNRQVRPAAEWPSAEMVVTGFQRESPGGAATTSLVDPLPASA